jgi:hypothetical protein
MLRLSMNASKTLLIVIASVVSLGRLCFAQTPILLADDSKTPSVSVSWPARDGKKVELKGERRFQSAAQKSSLGPNIDCYVALGGTRLNRGLANPAGAVVLVGLYKKDASKPFFQDIADNAAVTISLRGVFMTQPAVPQPKTAMMHLRYMLEDLQACGLSGNARNLFNTSDPEDPILAKTSGGSVRPGCLDGKGADHGSVEAQAEADGSVSVTFTVPYALLRHTQDPYQRTNPGGFFEPNHFHVEIELLPKKAEETRPVEPQRTPGEPKPESKPEMRPKPLTRDEEPATLGLCQACQSTRMRSFREPFAGAARG